MEDYTNIRITEVNNRFLERLVKDSNIFVNDKSAAMFAIAYAINHDIDLSINESYSLEPPVMNKWDANSIDNEGVFRLLISKRHSNPEYPFRFLQSVLDAGLNKMREIAPDNGFINISEFINKG